MLAADLVAHYQSLNLGTYATDLFTTTKANIPVLASGLPTIQILETGGTAPDHIHNSATRPAYLQPSAQITVRATSPDTARLKAEELFYASHVRNAFINSGWYMWIKPLQNPFDGGVDERGQARFQFNVIGKKRSTQ